MPKGNATWTAKECEALVGTGVKDLNPAWSNVSTLRLETEIVRETQDIVGEEPCAVGFHLGDKGAVDL